MSGLRALILTAGACCLLTTVAEAQRPNRNRDRDRREAVVISAGFTTAEREAITAFFDRNPMNVEGLPPGIAKNLARGKPLPPGIAKRQPPPALLEAVPPRDGLEISILGDRIVLLEASGLVVDVLEGILR